MKLAKALLISYILFVTLGHSSPVEIGVTNHDFETNAPGEGSINGATPAGWTSTNSGDYTFNTSQATRYYNHPDFSDAGATGGERGTMDGPTFGGCFSTGNTASFEQVLGTNLQSHSFYELKVAVGHRTVDSGSTATASDVTIELLAAGNVIATATASPSGGAWDDAQAGEDDDDIWADITATGSTGASPAGLGEALTIRISKAAAGDYMDVDNVRLSFVSNANPPEIIDFSSTKSKAKVGEQFTLSWNVEGAETVTITPDIGTVEASGSTDVSFTGNVTYQLVAQSADGSQVTAEQSVTLDRGIITVYLMGGQSNMQGVARSSKLDGTGLAEIEELLFYHSDDVHSTANAYTLATVRPAGYTNGYFGPEIGFAEKMRDFRPGHPMCLIKHAAGGTSLQVKWNPGVDSTDTGSFGVEYATFVNTVNGGLNALKAEGWTPQIEGMLWQQGEQDSKEGVNTNGDGNATSADDYGANLKHFVERVREQFADDISPDGMRFVLGQVSPYYPAGGSLEAAYPGRDKVRQAQLNADEGSGALLSIINTGTVPTNDQEFTVHEQEVDGFRDTDEAHFNSVGQLLLGRRMADEMLKLNPIGYQQWSDGFMLVGSEDDDEDGDGFSNRVEYLSGTSPVDRGSKPGIYLSLANDPPVLQYTRDLNASEAGIRVQISEDLDQWVDLDTGLSSVLGGNGVSTLTQELPYMSGSLLYPDLFFQLTE